MFTQAGNDLKIIDLGCRISNDNTRGHTKEFSAPEVESSKAKDINAGADIYSIDTLAQYIENSTCTPLPRYAKKNYFFHPLYTRYATMNTPSAMKQ